jgi:hypothetical protein
MASNNYLTAANVLIANGIGISQRSHIDWKAPSRIS